MFDIKFGSPPVIKFNNDLVIAAAHRTSSQWFTHVIDCIDPEKQSFLSRLNADYLDTPERQILLNYNLTDIKNKPIYLSTRAPANQYKSALTIPMFYWVDPFQTYNDNLDAKVTFCMGGIIKDATMCSSRVFNHYADIPYPYIDLDMGWRDRFRPNVYGHLYMAAAGLDIRPLSIENGDFEKLVSECFSDKLKDLSGQYHPLLDNVKTNQLQTDKTDYTTTSGLAEEVYKKLYQFLQFCADLGSIDLLLEDSLNFADKVYTEFSLEAVSRTKKENKEHAIHILRELFTDEKFKLAYGSELVNFKFYCQYIPELDSIRKDLKLGEMIKSHNPASYWSWGIEQLYLLEDKIAQNGVLDNSTAWR